MSAQTIGQRIDTIPHQAQIRRNNPAGNFRPRKERFNPYTFAEASDTSSSSEATSKTPEVDSTTQGKSTHTDSTGSGSSSGGTTNQKTPAETGVKTSSNSWTTLKLFIASLVLGAGSLTAHFTDFLGEGPIKNLVSFGLDTGTTLGLALTASSALAPINSDVSQHNLN